ncbi:unnamed protein product [Macrosiphum euphorbiae]|uniref:YqaJ viral recombinase domain-containing protein n=1 Tax=Macrosiphum euphorbiae TaxID=13131 RepID=A0AAV0Y7G2_9HEMI|nr:unnamed protein product [Macrosiphum euphorbiae]
MRCTTSCKNTVYDLLYASEAQAKSLQYGRDMEAIARKEIEKNIDKKFETCGLLIDPIIPYLAASPDGLIEDIAILEIKCPFSAKDTLNAIDAVKNKLLQYCKIIDGSIKLKL